MDLIQLGDQEKSPTNKLSGDHGPLDVEASVRNRYGAAANAQEAALCCPVDYDRKYLEVIPQEVLDRDYGCGDPSKYVSEGETVLDLGSGGGKICFIAAQVVGKNGQVIGVDRNEEMLMLARKSQEKVAEKIGFSNVDFRKGSIQDLALDYDKFSEYLTENKIDSPAEWLRAEAAAENLRQSDPLVMDNSIDVVVSNCVLNLVQKEDRHKLFSELFRVLKPGGRAVISDITSDEYIPEYLQNDSNLWSGCISGAFVESEFLEAFEEAGFYGIEILERQEEAWATVEGIEFRSVTVRAYKAAEPEIELDKNQAVLYKGPFETVMDEEGMIFYRGERMAVSDKMFKRYSQAPYAEHLTLIQPYMVLSDEEAEVFDPEENSIRPPQESKGFDYGITRLPGVEDETESCCGPEGCS